jgi:dephospho-CoA kinase
MLIIGLTGGVASGKTVVSQILREEGAYIIDADLIARKLVQPHTPVWNELKKVFGREILNKDGSIHRKRLAAKIYSDTKQREILNRILHPQIKSEMGRRVKEIGKKDPDAIVVIDAALLIELGDHRETDKVIVVTSTKKQQIERLKERDGMEQKEALRILSSQMPLKEKLKVADIVIRNEGSFEETKKRVRKVFRELKRIVLTERLGTLQTSQKGSGG